MTTMEITNMPRMFRAVTTPNCFSIWLWVKMNVANPRAVVKLVSNVALPTLTIIRCKAIALMPCRLYSAWYLLTK